MIRLLLPLLLFGLLPARLLGAADDLTTHTAPDGTPFYVLGALPSSPRPTLLIFAAEGRKALEESNFSEVGRLLRQEAEYLCLALDLPAHASDQRPGEPPGLKGWRARVDRGEDFVTPFAARISALLDHLVRTGRTDPARIAIAGTSRGGFMACQVAAREPRIGAVVAFSPVTDLPALTEFSGMEKDPLTLSLAAARLAPRLAGRPVWIVIGNHDRRVD
ncbi:MAG: alpha/beta fold hydrolase, partial [Opitutaceae bacterium]|nr:alpha/beta fold hydrolase [Opitutaceae bacterium]